MGASATREARVDTRTTTGSSLLLTIPQAQDKFQVGRTTIYRMIQTGELPTVRIGRSVRIPRTALDEWLRQRLAEAD
jgi:excisionase family DNA binding protein